MKSCTKCSITKSLEDFPKCASKKDGRHSLCKACINIRNKEYRDKNLEKFNETRKKNYQKNIESMRAEKRKYYASHKQQKSNYDKVYRVENKDRIKQHKVNWELKNKHTPQFKLKRNLRRRVHHALQDNYKSAHTMELIGCDIEFFKQYIESQFTEGMSWDNYGTSGWHIDHIVPCCSFDLSNPEEQRKCFHYTNQRPLWAKDNLIKGKSLP